MKKIFAEDMLLIDYLQDKRITLACYRLENTEKQGPEKLIIGFNNFPWAAPLL
jgi:hypothetical protein